MKNFFKKIGLVAIILTVALSSSTFVFAGTDAVLTDFFPKLDRDYETTPSNINRILSVEYGSVVDVLKDLSHDDGGDLYDTSTNRSGMFTTTPQTKLDVNGGVGVWSTTQPCSVELAGAIRYNTSTDYFEGCVGTSWTRLDCTPNCSEKVCGDNGCGGSCGTCPPKNCDSNDGYVLTGENTPEGTAVCEQRDYSEVATTCVGATGACTDPTCDEYTVLGSETVGACFTITGCVGETPATIVQESAGTTCDVGKICTDAGVCCVSNLGEVSTDPATCGAEVQCDGSLSGGETCDTTCNGAGVYQTCENVNGTAQCVDNPRVDCSPEWTDTTMCSEICGGGQYRRETPLPTDENQCGTCDTVDGSGLEILDGYAVYNGNVCNPQACPTYSWEVLTWGECSNACGDGMHDSATAECHRDDGVVVADTYCDAGELPLTESCNTFVAHDHTVCFENNSYWADCNDSRNDLNETCSFGCTAGACDGCTPATECTGGAECGTQSDGCSGTVDCGTCSMQDCDYLDTECRDYDDLPENCNSNTCESVTCDSYSNFAEGFAVAGGYCDGNGNVVECTADAHCDDSNDCTTDSCDGSHLCQHSNVADGSSCAGGTCTAGVCDGSCVGTIQNHCVLTTTISGGTSGSCDDGYAGTCTYSCDAGTWAEMGNTCCLSTDCTYEWRDTTTCSVTCGGGNYQQEAHITVAVSCGGTCPVTEGELEEGFTGSVCNEQSCCVSNVGHPCTDATICKTGTVACDGICNTSAGTFQCSGDTPYCDGAGTCVECQSSADCDDSISCTTDSCLGGACLNMNNPVNGGWSGWRAWECASGQQQASLGMLKAQLVGYSGEYDRARYRTCTNPAPSCGGTACLGSNIEEEDCAANEICSAGACVECVYDSNCNDGDSCTTDICSGGTCSHTNNPVNGGWSDWGAWECAGGQQAFLDMLKTQLVGYSGAYDRGRYRFCTNPAPSCGGAACSGLNVEEENCAADETCSNGNCVATVCTENSDCDDGNACTTDFCSSNTCYNTNKSNGYSTGLCSQCDGNGTEVAKTDDSTCGTISCDDWHHRTGTASAEGTDWCYDSPNITANRCEGIGNCKDANTTDCGSANDTLENTCGTCKYVGGCAGTTNGYCQNSAAGISCGTDLECDGSGNCVCAPNCEGNVCGDDGCGGSCGMCATNQSCVAGGCCLSDTETCVSIADCNTCCTVPTSDPEHDCSHGGFCGGECRPNL